MVHLPGLAPKSSTVDPVPFQITVRLDAVIGIGPPLPLHDSPRVDCVPEIPAKLQSPPAPATVTVDEAYSPSVLGGPVAEGPGRVGEAEVRFVDEAAI